MITRPSTLLIVALLLCSCVAPRYAAPRLQTFNEADYRSSLEDGTATVIGEAFLTIPGGGVHPGAGRVVQLIPVTPYTTEVFERQFRDRERLTPRVEKRLDGYVRVINADSRGEFRFEHVPAGSYYLVCLILWEVDYEETRVAAVGRVTVGEGEQKRVVVTR